MSFYARNINGTEAQFIISSHKLTYKNIWFFKDNFINLHLKKKICMTMKKKKKSLSLFNAMSSNESWCYQT